MLDVTNVGRFAEFDGLKKEIELEHLTIQWK